ncbi:MAG: cell division protein FtsB [Thioploca sp.]|nr:cell division protein FtsB [Thioploca sp.]
MLKIGLAVSLLTMTIYLQYQFWFGEGGYQEYQTLQQAIKQQQQENTLLETSNQALAAEVVDLKQNLAAVEEQARTKLGMIKRDEVFYQIVE